MNGFLEGKRAEIADADRRIMELLRKRLDIATEIGRYKAENGMEVRDLSVEQRVVERYRALARESGMDPDIAEEICRAIMRESVANEDAVRK